MKQEVIMKKGTFGKVISMVGAFNVNAKRVLKQSSEFRFRKETKVPLELLRFDRRGSSTASSEGLQQKSIRVGIE